MSTKHRTTKHTKHTKHTKRENKRGNEKRVRELARKGVLVLIGVVVAVWMVYLAMSGLGG